MTVIIETETEEQKAIREEIRETKKQIKELVKIQKEEKALLHTPHCEIPEIEVTMFSGNKYMIGGIRRAGDLMGNTLNRACEITKLHIQYNQMRGKPYDMHEYKKGEE